MRSMNWWQQAIIVFLGSVVLSTFVCVGLTLLPLGPDSVTGQEFIGTVIVSLCMSGILGGVIAGLFLGLVGLKSAIAKRQQARLEKATELLPTLTSPAGFQNLELKVLLDVIRVLFTLQGVENIQVDLKDIGVTAIPAIWPSILLLPSMGTKSQAYKCSQR